MNSYQQMILDRLEQTAMRGLKIPVRTVSVAYNWANTGRLMVTRTTEMRTIVTADFDFQTERVHIILNNPDGPRSMMVSRAPKEDNFYWRIGTPEGDAVVARLFARWAELIKEGLA
jgi:hypothetical protein